MLKSDALYWWESFVSSKGSDVYETLTWEEFSTGFKVQFCPQAAVRQLEDEFMHLQQDNMTVRDYTAKFLEKSRFAEYHVATEARKVERYIFGLNSSIRGYVIVMKPETFTATVDAAETTERDRGRDVSNKNVGKRKWEGPPPVFKRPNFPRFDRRPPFKLGKKPCFKCNQIHQGECRPESRICYRCGKPGHVILNCPLSRFCSYCNSPNHLQSDCPQMKVRRSNMGGKWEYYRREKGDSKTSTT